jgi:hypothetical protein
MKFREIGHPAWELACELFVGVRRTRGGDKFMCKERSRMMHSRIFTTLMVLGAASFAPTGIALAASPTANGYDETSALADVPGSPPGATESPAGSTESPAGSTESPVESAESPAAVEGSQATQAPAEDTAGPATAESGVAGESASSPATAPAAAAIPAAQLTASRPVANSGSSLPFTGLDIGIVVVGGLLLLGLGLLLRRSVRRTPAQP